MRRYLLLFGLAGFFGLNSLSESVSVGSPTVTTEAGRLVAIVANVGSAFEEKWSAAEAVKKCPPTDVYAAVFAHLSPPPDSNSVVKINVGWDAHRHDDLVKAPPEWQSCLLLGQIWYDMGGIARDDRGVIVAKLLPKATNDTQRFEVLVDLGWCWAPEAEESVVALMRDRTEDLEIRLRAADILMRRVNRPAYRSEIRDSYLADKKLSLSERIEWLQKACTPPWGEGGVGYLDAKQLELGFDLLNEGMTRPRWQGDASTYGAALCLGKYVGVEGDFAPSIKDPKYHVDGNLTDEYFTDTVRNAKRWWMENRERLTKSTTMPAKKT